MAGLVAVRNQGGEGLPACLVLIYGIPGSGKSLLTRHLLTSSRSSASGDEFPPWRFIPVHFDDLYPADLRLQAKQAESTADDEHFVLKEARKEVSVCLERLVVVNGLGSCREGERQEEGGLPTQWERFVHSINSNCGQQVLESSGSLRHWCPPVLLLDDNLPLRSMRHEYYQLARQYHLGFVEVCIQCPVSLALERNSQRPIPIPHSTIGSMEQRLEPPDPAKHPWEQNSLILSNDGDRQTFLKTAWETLAPLIEHAFANPVLPLTVEDTSIKESCRTANLESYIHQADNILRKCVSTALKKQLELESPKKVTKSAVQVLAQQANAARRKVLEELRSGLLGGIPITSPTSVELREALEVAFFSELA